VNDKLKGLLQFMVAIIGSLLIIGVMVFVLVSLIGCNTFKVIQVKGQPDECNDFYTTMMFYAEQSKGKGQGDSAFIGTVYNECNEARAEARKKLRENHCRNLIYGEGIPVDKKDYEKYTHFLECSK
jgi:hypothetical protein